jgi:hypothetical protein
MKKILFLCFIVLSAVSCNDSNLKALEAKSKDSKCKLEKMQELMGYENILAMSISLKLEKEHEKAIAAFSDSTKTCEQANQEWDSFMKLYDSASKKAGF